MKSKTDDPELIVQVLDSYDRERTIEGVRAATGLSKYTIRAIVRENRVKWYKQSHANAATYGSELTSVKVAVGQIRALVGGETLLDWELCPPGVSSFQWREIFRALPSHIQWTVVRSRDLTRMTEQAPTPYVDHARRLTPERIEWLQENNPRIPLHDLTEEQRRQSVELSSILRDIRDTSSRAYDAEYKAQVEAGNGERLVNCSSASLKKSFGSWSTAVLTAGVWL